jgi:predicted short-subunit dehydrogenase-like oxidoreductase (DUF2520 family)
MPNTEFTITIIGAGNVAWHLALALDRAGHHIYEISNRKLNHAKEIADLLYDTKISSGLNFEDNPSDLFILAVSDDAIIEICGDIVLPKNALLVHTSGSKTLEDILKPLRTYSDFEVFGGVFYPLMTFSKGVHLDFESIPLCIEAENDKNEAILIEIANSISNEVYLINSAERASLHVSAVFACNFTNHMLALSKEILESENITFDLLKPIITQTFQKALKAKHPADVQTGPAKRKDNSTVLRHLDYLSEDEDLVKVYECLTKSIQDWHQG